MALTDEALAEFICPYDVAMGLRFLATATPERRAVYERMVEVVNEIDLWEAGVGPKPTGVIICGPKQIRSAR